MMKQYDLFPKAPCRGLFYDALCHKDFHYWHVENVFVKKYHTFLVRADVHNKPTGASFQRLHTEQTRGQQPQQQQQQQQQDIHNMSPKMVTVSRLTGRLCCLCCPPLVYVETPTNDSLSCI